MTLSRVSEACIWAVILLPAALGCGLAVSLAFPVPLPLPGLDVIPSGGRWLVAVGAVAIGFALTARLVVEAARGGWIAGHVGTGGDGEEVTVEGDG